MFTDLRSFLSELKKQGDLVEVSAPVDARLEVAEIHRRVIAARGPALLFPNVIGADFPLVTNLFGTARRAELAFGENPQRLIEQAVWLAENLFPPKLGTFWEARDLFRGLLSLGVRSRRSGPVLDRVQSRPRLDRLPVLTCWPEDGGPFITLPLVYTEHPEGRGHNLGIYRLQVHGPDVTGMHWQIGKGGGFHYAVAERREEALPVTVFLGGPPALILSAVAPLPENVPELLLASLIAGKRLQTCEGPGGRRMIANAEFALVGKVPPRLRQPEGPFGDHYGYYSLQHDHPVLQLEAIAHRKDAIYPATVVGKPRQEDFYIGDLLQELLSPLFPLVMPSVRRLWSYGETGYHSLAAAVVEERYKREAVSAAFRILGEGQLSLTKFLFVTDGDVELKDFPATLQHVLVRTRPETDLFVFPNLSMDTLDYTGPRVNEGSKGLWLGLGDPVRELPDSFEDPEQVPELAFVRPFCPGCLVVEAKGTLGDDEIEKLLANPAFEAWPLIVLSDEGERACAGTMNFLWTTFTRFEPAADIYARDRLMVRNHLALKPPILIDARRKPDFPAELTCAEPVARKVTERWKEYFPAGMEMGDSDQANLEPSG